MKMVLQKNMVALTISLVIPDMFDKLCGELG